MSINYRRNYLLIIKKFECIFLTFYRDRGIIEIVLVYKIKKWETQNIANE